MCRSRRQRGRQVRNFYPTGQNMCRQDSLWLRQAFCRRAVQCSYIFRGAIAASAQGLRSSFKPGLLPGSDAIALRWSVGASRGALLMQKAREDDFLSRAIFSAQYEIAGINHQLPFGILSVRAGWRGPYFGSVSAQPIPETHFSIAGINGSAVIHKILSQATLNVSER